MGGDATGGGIEPAGGLARPITRRAVLVSLGAGAAASTILQRLALAETVLSSLSSADPSAAAGLPGRVLTARLVRPQDQVDLAFTFHNLKVDGRVGAPRLVRDDATKPSYVVVDLGPQHVIEEVAQLGEEFDPSLPIWALVAGNSRLAFRVPGTVDEIPFTAEGLLDWRPLVPNVPRFVNPTTGGTMRAPAATETAIEAPVDLFLAPSGRHTWAHAVAPVTHGGGAQARTELWHTRLAPVDGTRPDERPGATSPVRAVWMTGFEPATLPDDAYAPHHVALTSEDRWSLVRQTTDYHDTTSPGYEALPIDARLLHLSSRGASLDLQGSWADRGETKGINLTVFQERASTGRDNFVRVDRTGFLMPFGFPAVNTTITERRFVDVPNIGTVAELVQRSYITVVRPEMALPGDDSPLGRKWPLRLVRVKTLRSPDFAPADTFRFPNPGGSSATGLPDGYAFFPRIDGRNVAWTVEGVDWTGATVQFQAAMAFVQNRSSTIQGKPSAPERAMTAYNDFVFRITADTSGFRTFRPSLDGQQVAFSPEDAPGQATFPVSELELSVQPYLYPGRAYPLPTPGVRTARIRVAAADALGAAGPDGELVKYFKPYLDEGFYGANAKAQVVLESVIRNPLTFPADAVGGIAVPNISLAALSRTRGAIGGDALAQLVADVPQFDPVAYFGTEAKILGGARLTDILRASTSSATPGSQTESVFDPFQGKAIPDLQTELIYPDDDRTKLPEGYRVTYAFEPHLKSGPIIDVDRRGTSKFRLVATVEAPIGDPSAATYEVQGSLTNFDVLLPPAPNTFIALLFARMGFDVRSGSKPDLDVGLLDVEFRGPLTFLNDLREVLGKFLTGGAAMAAAPVHQAGPAGSALAVDGTELPSPDIDVNAQGITVGVELAIPTLSVGVFTVENIAIGLSVLLPFDGSPARFRFNFASRERPFCVTYSCLGGGGYLAITVGTDGVELVEASIEFGGKAQLNFGPVSGGIEIMAGVYFKLEQPETGPQTVELTGYVRLHGWLSAGPVGVSIDVNVSLGYVSPSTAFGRAELHIEIDAVLVSINKTFTIERKFKGSNTSATGRVTGGAGTGALPSGSTFAATLTPEDWATYCAQFAA